jgi:hypothetical protein
MRLFAALVMLGVIVGQPGSAREDAPLGPSNVDTGTDSVAPPSLTPGSRIYQPPSNAEDAAPASDSEPKPAPPSPVIDPSSPHHIQFIYPDSCTHSQSDNQDNLCIQARAANAAESQAFWAALTFVVAVFGTIGVLWTLHYTAKAANAAKAAADALPALERAHIFVEIGGSNIASILAQLSEFDSSGASLRGSNRISMGDGSVRPTTFDDGQHVFEVRFRFINHGKTPAIIKEVSASVDHFTAMNEPSYMCRIPIVTDVVVPSGYQLGADHTVTAPDKQCIQYLVADDILVSHSMAVAVREGQCVVWFYGRIVYDDVFGTEHITAWWRRYHVTRNRLVWHGDSKYNRRT